MNVDSQRDSARGWRLPVCVATALVIVLLAHRFAIGADLGFMLRAPDAAGTVASGIVEYPEDNLAYVSHAEQARRGDLLFANPFAIGPQDNIYFNPLFLAIGNLARWTGLRPAGWLVVVSLLGAFATVVLAHRIALRVGLSLEAANWTAVLVAFGSGLSAVSAALAGAGGADAWIGVDRTHQDTITFSVFAVYPFQGVTLAVLAIAIHAALCALDAATSRRRLAWLATVTLISGLLRPYECMMFSASLCAYAALAPAAERRRRVLVGAAAAAAAVPAVGYAFWVSRQVAWREYGEITVSMLDISRGAWVIGYGMFLPAALIGAWIRPRETGTWPDRRAWFTIWVGVLSVLLIGLHIDQVKLSSGMQIPLAVLAGHGCATLRRRIAAIGATAPRRLATGLGALAVLGFFPTTLLLLGRVYDAHRIDADLVDAADAIDAASDAPPRVLCDSEAGRVLPALARSRVFVGHWSMTPARIDKLAELLEAGIEVDRRGVHRDIVPSRARFDALLAEVQPRFVLLAHDAAANAFAQQAGMTLAQTGQRWSLYVRE